MGMLKDPNESAIKIIILVFSKFHYKNRISNKDFFSLKTVNITLSHVTSILKQRMRYKISTYICCESISVNLIFVFDNQLLKIDRNKRNYLKKSVIFSIFSLLQKYIVNSLVFKKIIVVDF